MHAAPPYGEQAGAYYAFPKPLCCGFEGFHYFTLLSVLKSLDDFIALTSSCVDMVLLFCGLKAEHFLNTVCRTPQPQEVCVCVCV